MTFQAAHIFDTFGFVVSRGRVQGKGDFPFSCTTPGLLFGTISRLWLSKHANQERREGHV
jgi:hypothetical protein